MQPTTRSIELSAEQRAQFVEYLTEENLSALMRSTWTWDDRALRRTLSGLLVELTAIRELRVGEVEFSPGVIEAAEARALATAGEFVAEVLGPRLLIDSGNAYRDVLLPLVLATSDLAAAAERALDQVAVEVTGFVIERNESLSAILPEDRWDAKSFGRSSMGTAQVAYSAGYTISDTDYFAAAGLGAQAYSVAGSPTDDSIDVRRSTLAAAEKTGSWDPALVRTRAVPTPDGWNITGEKWYVPGASTARTLFVIARSIGGPSLYLVEHDAAGVDIKALDTLDDRRPLSHITFENTPATLIGREGAGGRIMNRTVDKTTTILAAEQMGLVDRALKDISKVPPSTQDNDSWRRYTRRLAELEVLRACGTALWYRAAKLQNGDDLDAGGVAAAMAHIGCSNALRQVALTLGSAGESIDADTANAIRQRARSTDLLLGGPALAHERMLERIGI
ncbi:MULTISPECIES: acyl-CoA dehydrogenase family protein [Actinomycetes]|uniref:acyl-CoA dehydrogenase family protein n=1 Tax=Actinomycetes TaxID=1760 RepID=UPI00068ED6AA|nr:MULTISPECIES: acyl-CoA dehydrogenase family protein [Actinomycetes]